MSAFLLCGEDVLQYQFLEIMLYAFQCLTPAEGIFDGISLSAITEKFWIADTLFDSEKGSLDLLGSLRYRLATNPRDYVYGVLNLFPKAVSAVVCVDYSILPEMIYCEAITRLCRSAKDFDVLLDWCTDPWFW